MNEALSLSQELEAEMGEKEVLLSALKATSDNIMAEFKNAKESERKESGDE